MPTATAPLGKPGAAKTASIKPAGLSRQNAAKNEAAEEEEEEQGLQPVHLGVAVVALLLAGFFLFTTYKTDQTPNRVSEYLFGKPNAEDTSGYSSSDDDDSSSTSSAKADDEDDGDSGDEDDE